MELVRNLKEANPQQLLDLYAIVSGKVKDVAKVPNARTSSMVYLEQFHKLIAAYFERAVDETIYKKELRDVEAGLRAFLNPNLASLTSPEQKRFYKQCWETVTARLRKMWV